MDAVRCDISAFTASFRLPGVMGYQATALAPPPSTIFGLLSAAVGRDVAPMDLEWVAYRFTFAATATDLEKIIAYGEKGPFQDEKLGGINTVPIKREFLYDPRLVLYLPPGSFEEALRRPRFPICLGRSSDVATVESVRLTTLNNVNKASVEGVLIPFPCGGKTPASVILSLPTYMQSRIPRSPACVGIFHVVSTRQEIECDNLYIEPDEELAVPILTRELLTGSSGKR